MCVSVHEIGKSSLHDTKARGCSWSLCMHIHRPMRDRIYHNTSSTERKMTSGIMNNLYSENTGRFHILPNKNLRQVVLQAKVSEIQVFLLTCIECMCVCLLSWGRKAAERGIRTYLPSPVNVSMIIWPWPCTYMCRCLFFAKTTTPYYYCTSEPLRALIVMMMTHSRVSGGPCKSVVT